MNLLLDTHVLIWWVRADRGLSKTTRELIASASNHIAISAATLWEIAIKKGLGRIDIHIGELMAAIKADGFEELPVHFDHAALLERLPDHHRDPFDRLLIAQAIASARHLVTHDSLILAYEGVPGFHTLRV